MVWSPGYSESPDFHYPPKKSSKSMEVAGRQKRTPPGDSAEFPHPSKRTSAREVGTNLLPATQAQHPILRMDEILHMGNHCLLVFTRESSEAGVSERWCEMDFATIHRSQSQHPRASTRRHRVSPRRDAKRPNAARAMQKEVCCGDELLARRQIDGSNSIPFISIKITIHVKLRIATSTRQQTRVGCFVRAGKPAQSAGSNAWLRSLHAKKHH